MLKPIRAARVFGHILLGLVLLVLTGGLRDNGNRVVKATKRWWLFRVTRLLGMEIDVIGSVPETSSIGTLFISNHVSWTDIPVIGGLTQLNFLSKAEVKKWPLIGRLAEGTGTLFIQRGSGDTGQVSLQMADYLRQGRSVLFFPEGTSSDGRGLLRFHRKLFQTCEHVETRVCPVVIHYAIDGADHNPVAFVGDDEFTRHLWRLLGYPRIRVTVSVLPLRVLKPDTLDQQISEMRQAMVQQLDWLHGRSDINTSVQSPDASSRDDRTDQVASA